METQIKENRIINILDKILSNKNYNKEFFDKNIKGLKIKHTYKTNTSYYDILSNKITYNPNKINEQLPHELLHLSSTVQKDGVCKCGFSEIDFNTFKYRGEGLNELYTHLLDYYLFNNQLLRKVNKEEMESITSLLIIKLEDIIGAYRMPNLYFNANLEELINILNKYISEEEIDKLLNLFDKLYNYYYRKQGKYSIKEISQCIKEVRLILAKIEYNKICLSYINEYIDSKAYYKQYKEIVNNLNEIITRKKFGDLINFNEIEVINYINNFYQEFLEKYPESESFDLGNNIKKL